ncbi:PadR family transcriptional regulator [Kribbella sp. NPDC055071]
MPISARYTKLTPTAWTILGFLAFSPRNGYQLRQAVQRSAGHFWGVSYGQLYAQLDALSAAGLIEPAETEDLVWRLTDDGAEALREWLGEPPKPTQRRDENLVKLLFSDHAGIEVTRQLVAQRREAAKASQAKAEAIVPGAHWDPVQRKRRPGDLLAARLVREHTLAMAAAELTWCDRADELIEGASRG